jgi:hypothetical protein
MSESYKKDIPKLAPCTERYLDKEDIYEPIFDIARTNNRYFETHPGFSDEEYKPEDDTYLSVTNFSELLKYVRDNLEEKTPGTVVHTGPIANETKLIREKLLKFFDNNIITFDSEPGLVLVEPEEIIIQRPYVEVMASKETIKKMIEGTAKHEYIRYVDYNNRMHILSDFKNFEKKDDYVAFFGTRYMTIDDTLKSYYGYIFSDKFFDDLLKLAL